MRLPSSPPSLFEPSLFEPSQRAKEAVAVHAGLARGNQGAVLPNRGPQAQELDDEVLSVFASPPGHAGGGGRRVNGRAGVLEGSPAGKRKRALGNGDPEQVGAIVPGGAARRGLACRLLRLLTRLGAGLSLGGGATAVHGWGGAWGLGAWVWGW